MGPTMAEIQNPKPPSSDSISISTPAPNPQIPRRSRPRVREVSSRFMSPVTSSSPSVTSSSNGNGDSHHHHHNNHFPPSVKSPLNPNPNPRSVPSTPSDSHLSRNHSLRRSNSVQRNRFGDENRSDLINRGSISPVRGSKPRSAVKLFKEPSRVDTPVPQTVSGARLARYHPHRTWDTAASKLLQANTNGNALSMSMSSDHSSNQGDGGCSENGDDCDSVKSEPCDHGNSSTSISNGNGGECMRVSTPMSRSMEHPFSSHEQGGLLHSVKGRGGGGGGGCEGGLVRSGKVARSLNLPPVHPPTGCVKPQGAGEVKKGVGVRKGSNQQEDVHRLKLLHNYYLQWKFANAKAEASMVAQKRENEKQLYSLGVKISELQDSVKSKRAEFDVLRRAKTLSTILDAQMPYLDEWSALEEDYSSSWLALTQGLLNVSSQLPLDGNIRADAKEIEEALNGSLKALEMIFLQVQSFMPKAEQVDGLISNLARAYSGEIALVEECGHLLSKTHLSQVEECSLRGQLMQFHQFNLNQLVKEQA